MAVTVNLLTNQDDLDTFHKLVDGRKKEIKVDREKLYRLLIDVGVLTNAIQSSSTFRLVTPEPKRQREKLKM